MLLAEERKTSTHKVEVVPVSLQKHPNADTLSVVQVFGYQCIVRTTDWLGVNKAAYIVPDSLVDIRRPEFSFLADQAKADGKARIKAKKLRGIVSFGLLIPVGDDAVIGDDWAEKLGVEHYEPELHSGGGKKGVYLGGEVGSAPNLYHVKYDLEAFRRYHDLFEEGEPVMVTEKLDGCNSRYVYHDGQMYCGSRTEWKKEYPSYEHLTVANLVAQGVPEERAQDIIDKKLSQPKKKNLWWEILEKTPSLEKFCRDNPDVMVYGEIYGSVNCIKYGLPDGNRFAAFDVLKDGNWVNAVGSRAMLEAAGVPVVPLINPACVVEAISKLNGSVYELRREHEAIHFNFDELCKLAEGPTLVLDAKPGTPREGCVIKPLTERWNVEIGRVCLKLVSATFLEKYR